MICYLCRHGRDDDTVRGGWSRHSLTEEGAAQAEALAALAESLHIRHIYASDLPRAMETAQPAADRLGLPVVPLPGFREVNNGVLAGMKNELVDRLYPGLYWSTLDWEQCYPGGESPRAFYERICGAWDTLQRELREQNEDVLLVTHGGVIQVLLAIVGGGVYSNRAPLRRIGNTELIPLEYSDGAWRERCHHKKEAT